MNSKPRAGKSPRPNSKNPAAQPAQEPSLADKVTQAQADKEMWGQVAAHPNLSTAAASAARDLARSSAAALTLGQKALTYQDANSDQMMQTLLGVGNPPQGQPSNSGQNPPNS